MVIVYRQGVVDLLKAAGNSFFYLLYKVGCRTGWFFEGNGIRCPQRSSCKENKTGR